MPESSNSASPNTENRFVWLGPAVTQPTAPEGQVMVAQQEDLNPEAMQIVQFENSGAVT